MTQRQQGPQGPRRPRRQEYRVALRGLSGVERTAYLDRNSGLPGPRGNLELMEAAADEGDLAWFVSLAQDADEFRAATGAVGLGKVLAEGCDGADDGPRDAELVTRLHGLAGDPRWRVREGVAMALQRLGDRDLSRLWRIARAWAADDDPLVQRAAVAGVCEPRLLTDPEDAGAALDLCAAVTDHVARRPDGQRRSPGVRTLRQALGYCWSVAVAAAPEPGVARFLALADSSDPDVGWIVRQNLGKARLKRLLPASPRAGG